MSTAILDREQRRSGDSTVPVLSLVRPAVPTRRESADRPAGRRGPVVLLAPRPAVGCAGTVGAQPIERGYRMGRWARLTVTLSVVATGFIVLFGGHSATTGGTVDVVTTSGQSVWSIARDQVGPAADPQAVGARADLIRQINGLQAAGATDELPAGSVLQVPVG